MSHSLSLSPSFSSRSVLAVFPPSHFSLSLFVCLSLSLSLSQVQGHVGRLMRSFTPLRLQFHISLSLSAVLLLSVLVPRAPPSLQGGDPLETCLESVRGEKGERKKQASFLFFFYREGLLTRARKRLHHKPANTLPVFHEQLSPP